ncbi:MAG TPA: DNA polymerase I, partial [Clostridiales bacterium UBA8153]|nr:DNA polymerase I [Clostridiales bacterium UBA8153]
MQKVLLIDGNSLVNRAFYALPRLSAGEQPTGAVYGFLTMLLKLMEAERPDGVAVAFDTPAPTFRHRQYTAYKAHRTGMPEELAAQLPVLKAILEALGLVMWEVEGCEADDVLGTAACRAAHRGNRVVIVSGDRDVLQLVGPHTRVMLTRHRSSQLDEFDEARLREVYGLSPAQFIELKGLMGDASDNIPGVPGIGEKRAIAVLKAFGSIENALSRIEEVEPKSVREALAAHGEQARLSRELAAIKCDLTLEELEPGPWRPHEEAVAALFAKYQFTSLLPRLGLERPPVVPVADQVPEHAWCQHPEELENFLAGASGQPIYIYSWPSGGPGWRPGALAIYSRERPVFCLDLRAGAAGELAGLHAALASGLPSGTELVVHDGKPLISWAMRQDLPALHPAFDSMLAAYLLDPTRSSYRLEDTCRDSLGLEIPPAPRTAGGREGPGYSQEELGVHLAAGAGALPRLRQALDKRLVAQGMDGLYEQVELPLVEVLAAMESAGIAVDVDRARDMAKEFGGTIGRLAQSIYALAGGEFNINSTRQLAEVLFDRLRMPTRKRTKTGYSTDAEVLEALAPQYEIAARILEYRQLVKLKGTYLDGLEQWVDPLTGRLHTTFNQAATATGRLSSADPNLQNIPVRVELGRMIRRVFVAPAGSVLLAADYSQIELRVLAHLA